mmetsp:Transcript_5490/g.8575  ORF Transcript_5490/g.8575 Transcript_5490/m.8575 type:complete len:82 (-) Transcript_5490:169-414(-)
MRLHSLRITGSDHSTDLDPFFPELTDAFEEEVVLFACPPALLGFKRKVGNGSLILPLLFYNFKRFFELKPAVRLRLTELGC